MAAQTSTNDLYELERIGGALTTRFNCMGKYIPETFIAPSPEAEALGQALLVFKELVQYIPITEILAENGLDHVEPQRWYPMQNALNVFKALYQDAQSPNYDLVRIGMKSMEAFKFPPEVDSIETALRSLDSIAKTFSRHVPDGYGFPLQIVGERHALITNNIPVPDSGVYGFIWNVINNHKAADEIYLVRALPNEPGSPTVFEVKWGWIEDGSIE